MTHTWTEVVKRVTDGSHAKLWTDADEPIQLHRFAVVGKSDRIRQQEDGTLVALAKHAKEPEVVIHPTWHKEHHLNVLGQPMSLVIKEIEHHTELDGYEKLTNHHYKSGPGPGRRAPLVATLCNPNLPHVVGFVEVCSAFLVNVPRKSLLDAPYVDHCMNVSWERWDIETAKKYINVVARISRCVVLPELRGLGLATMLADAAAEFATARWHYGGHRPAFLEITAEMLRYWPFVRKSGFIHLGDTQGNDTRLRKTMQYLLERRDNGLGFPKGGGGIVSMHRSHATILEQLVRDRGWTNDQLFELLTKSPEELEADDWISLHAVYRRPKPVYMRGLSHDANAHLKRHQVHSTQRKASSSDKNKPALVSLEINFTDVIAQCDAERSKHARLIQEAFGIVAKSIRTTIASNLTIRLDGGQVILVSGPSGSGKSLLLRALLWYASGQHEDWKMPAATTSTASLLSSSLRVETWRAPDPASSPISILASMGLTLTEAMQSLSAAGLAEASIFVRPSSTLSSGQYYRLGLAIALARKPELLVIDEFCEALDDFTTSAVCRRLMQKIQKEGIALVVATSGADRVSACLKPAARLRLYPSGEHKWSSITVPTQVNCNA